MRGGGSSQDNSDEDDAAKAAAGSEKVTGFKDEAMESFINLVWEKYDTDRTGTLDKKQL